VFSLDGEHTVVHMNAAAARMTGRDLRSAVGERIEDVVTVETDPSTPGLAEVVSEVAETGVAKSVEHSALLVTDDGATLPVDFHVIRVPRYRDSQTQVVVTLRDATRSRRRFAEVEERAIRDPLTGLLNREHLARREAAAAETGSAGGLAIVMLDLDKFKVVNDSCGHAAGDHVLRDVASLLRAHTRGSDEVVRYGGDEFVVLLDDCSDSFALRVAEEIVAAVASHPFEYEGRRFDIGVSAGVAVCHGDRRLDLHELLLEADRASYRAKRSGGDRVALAAAA
jgi:diguanylate cyclase (GGDEF)-like protein